jgi:two-component system response regulator YesN
MFKDSQLDQNDAEKQFLSSIDVVVEYVENHISEDLTLEDMAYLVDLSPGYFNKYFKTKTGKKFIDYVSQRRIYIAVELLENPKLRINEICDMVVIKVCTIF